MFSNRPALTGALVHDDDQVGRSRTGQDKSWGHPERLPCNARFKGTELNYNEPYK